MKANFLSEMACNPVRHEDNGDKDWKNFELGMVRPLQIASVVFLTLATATMSNAQSQIDGIDPVGTLGQNGENSFGTFYQLGYGPIEFSGGYGLSTTNITVSGPYGYAIIAQTTVGTPYYIQGNLVVNVYLNGANSLGQTYDASFTPWVGVNAQISVATQTPYALSVVESLSDAGNFAPMVFGRSYDYWPVGVFPPNFDPDGYGPGFPQADVLFGTLGYPGETTFSTSGIISNGFDGVGLHFFSLGAGVPWPLEPVSSGYTPTNCLALVSFNFSLVPPLSIQAGGSRITAAWPKVFTNYTLQTSSSLSPSAGWSLVTNTPVVQGEMTIVTVNITNYGSQFFRLKGPPGSGARAFELLHSFLNTGANPQSPLIQANDGAFYGETRTTAWRLTTNGAVDIFPELNNQGGLVQAGDGNFYGLSQYGGANNYGQVFRLSTNGIIATVANFSYSTGNTPVGSLILANDGTMYGATQGGGADGFGSIFNVTTNGALAILDSFDATNGSPGGTLFETAGGTFYGTTPQGGNQNAGSVFMADSKGNITTLASFDTNNGVYPNAPLILGNDGNFYGTCSGGGDSGSGTAFFVTPSGNLSWLANFEDYSAPAGALCLCSDGSFYGTTVNGGSQGAGTVFQLTPGGTITTIYSFTNYPGGANPYAGLMQGSDGRLYGTTCNGGAFNVGTAFAITTNGSLTTLLSFTSSDTNGTSPSGGLVAGTDGNFYGTTEFGGSNGIGMAFKISSNGLFTPIASFVRSNGVPVKGSEPLGRLLLASDGNFYGTASLGGTNLSSQAGTVFRLTTNGNLTRLAAFDGSTGGASPHAGLIQGRDGGLYGTTYAGGRLGQAYGTVFRITTNGTFTTLGDFSVAANIGAKNPDREMVQASNGSLFGTTSTAGNLNLNKGAGFGAIFTCPTNGSPLTVFTFANANGATPGNLVVGPDHNLYGTCFSGGNTNLNGGAGYGTVFEFTNGVLTTLVVFNGMNGANPQNLIAAGDGTMYGITRSGGANGYGTMFQVTTNGGFTILYSFTLSDLVNATAMGALVEGSDGTLYGTSLDGGPLGGGAVYRLVTIPMY